MGQPLAIHVPQIATSWNERVSMAILCSPMIWNLERRYLIIYFIHKTKGEALIVSAREMTQKEKRAYGRK